VVLFCVGLRPPALKASASSSWRAIDGYRAVDGAIATFAVTTLIARATKNGLFVLPLTAISATARL
jgi:hypothetical protein